MRHVMRISAEFGSALLGATFFLSAAFSGTFAGEAGQTHQVVIAKFKFIPAELTIQPGDTVEWINQDIAPHTATGSDKAWDTGRLRKNESGAITFSTAGQFDYFCYFHPAMKAVITVKGKLE